MTLGNNLIHILICLLLTGASYSLSDVITSELEVQLFKNYSVSLLPVCNVGENVTLSLDVALRQIIDLNEREQLISTNVWVRMTWKDCRLIWDPVSHGNVNRIVVPYTKVWIPDIALYDSAAEEEMMPGLTDYRAMVYSNGNLTYNFPTVIKSICRVNVLYFPFDTQNCNLTFGSWSYPAEELDVDHLNKKGDLSIYIENTEWTVSSLPAVRDVRTYDCCPGTYPQVVFTIVMERRPTFYFMTMIFPCLLTSVVAVIGFFLPPESGEKVSLEITVLLSLAVFLLVISEALPPSSETFPIMGSYFAAAMVLVSFSCLLTVFVLNVNYHGSDGQRVPKWARTVFLHKLRNCTSGRKKKYEMDAADKQRDEEIQIHHACVKKVTENGDVINRDHVTTSHEEIDFGSVSSADSLLREQVHCLRGIEKHMSNKDYQENIQEEWRQLARVLDMVFLAIYVLISVTVTLVFLLQVSMGNQPT